MAKHKHDKKPSSHHWSSSKEHRSSSKEHGSSSKEHSSSSEEHWHSKEKGSTCKDGKRNKKETDVDCGGKKCPPCADDKKCLVNRDCVSDFCKHERCAQRSTKKTSTTTAQPTRSAIPSVTTTTRVIRTTTTSQRQPSTTTEQPTTTTQETANTTTQEPTTTTEEMTTTTEQPTTTTTEEIETTTTQEPTTTETNTFNTTEEAITTTPEEITAELTCDPECKNGGTCTGHNICNCTSEFSGPTCEVQSVGLCLDKETFDVEPILQVTFGKGSSQFSNASPAQFKFTTTYTQRREPTIDDGYFTFINSIYNHHDAWHAGATDHTGDEGGYMYLVNANFEPGLFYSGRVDNLCVGLRYEFSVYLANLCKKAGRINPNVLFEVRSEDGNELLAQLNSGDIPERDTLTWEKYGLSFVATNSSVNLLMISNAHGGSGNDIVIDDIALRVCAHKGAGFCPSK